jgi:hypothetical protein
MITVGQLKEYLKHRKDDVIVRLIDSDIIGLHTLDDNTLILSDKEPIGYSKDGLYVYPSSVEGYKGYSPSLDEDLYDFEIIPFEEDSWTSHWQLRLEKSK